MIQKSNIELIEYFTCQNNLLSYDPYDIWKTKVGMRIRSIFYTNKYLGLIPAASLSLCDYYLNNKRRLFYEKQEFPVTRAQATLTLINLYKENKENKYLECAKIHINWLLENYSKGYSGYCWGLNFTWVYSAEELYDSNTPFSTHTPYPLEAFIEYYQLTQDRRLLEPIKSVLSFIENDLQVMFEEEDKLIVSYGPQKDRIVTNANAYVMYMYAMLLPLFPDKKEYIENKIQKIYNFLTSVQNSDGSWLYSPYNSNSFIDCFHSCFVIKNIYKTNQILELNSALTVVKKGYNYILKNFLDVDHFLFKRFAISNKPSLVKFDLYDNAEMLNLANLLKDKPTVKKLDKAIKTTFVEKNVLYSIIDIFGCKKNANHLRWAVVPYLYALSNLKEK